MNNRGEELLHWADEKEVVSSNKPLLLLFSLMKKLPKFIIFTIVWPIALFFYIFSKRGRVESKIYQKQLKTFTNGKIPSKIRPFNQILSFSLCIIEKMEGWFGNYHYNELIVHNDDLSLLQEQLKSGKGALLIGSHLGNIELLRSLSSFGENGVGKNISVTAVMELKSTEQFNKTLKEINPDVDFQVLDPEKIGIDTIATLQEQIENGGLVVITGDRTSSRARTRVIREKFLGKEADFPYGTFVLALLLKAPIYYVFGLRNHTFSIKPRYHIFVEKSEIKINANRSERDKKITELCKEFILKLENYCIKFPYQWYNFYNFWKLNDEAAK